MNVEAIFCPNSCTVVDVEIFYWIRINFILLVALDKAAGDHQIHEGSSSGGHESHKTSQIGIVSRLTVQLRLVRILSALQVLDQKKVKP